MERVNREDDTGLVLNRFVQLSAAEAQQWRRRMADGTAHRIRRGAATGSKFWAEASPRERYLTEIRAVVGTRLQSVVVSHLSAAAVWDFPVIGSWPTAVHLLAQP
jgi:hypothetical protein